MSLKNSNSTSHCEHSWENREDCLDSGSSVDHPEGYEFNFARYRECGKCGEKQYFEPRKEVWIPIDEDD